MTPALTAALELPENAECLRPIIERRLRALGAVVSAANAADLLLRFTVDPDLGAETFGIFDDAPAIVRISSGSLRGLLYGAGRYLRGCSRGEAGMVTSDWRGSDSPARSFRGIYFATHFYNYYHNAPLPQIYEYVEDLALQGCNCITVWLDLHHYTGIDDPQAAADISRLRSLLRRARRIGLDIGLLSLANEAYSSSPERLRADRSEQPWSAYLPAHYGVELCPSVPGAPELELRWQSEKLDVFADLEPDYLWIWPYDQGGCTCERCRPWGSNGFVSLAEPLARLFKERFGRGKTVLSTWLFDTFTSGEWPGLAQQLGSSPPDWIDYLMADSHGERPFPPFLLEHASPGGLPVIGFPEISMFRNDPWGGFGANPCAAFHQSRWDEVRHLMAGGSPYSEGIFEDINKAVWLQFYWNPHKPAAESVREYVAGWFSPAVVDEVAPALETLERNFGHSRRDEYGVTRFTTGGVDGAEDALHRISSADFRLPIDIRDSSRWRVIYLRALIDCELARHDHRASERLQAAFDELSTIYCIDVERTHAAVRPPANLRGVLPCRHP